MSKMKILVIFGTRPEAIKLAPVIRELKKQKRKLETIVCITGQHRHMLDQMLRLFNIKSDVDLNLMQRNQSLVQLSANALCEVSTVIKSIKPDLVMVQGDTTTAMIAALAGFYERVPVSHVEAGLRTRDIYNPFPEEINRRIISTLATFHFAPTQLAFKTLLDEWVGRDKVILTGNTVVDALKIIGAARNNASGDLTIPAKRKIILVTAHRRENFGKPIENICAAIKEIVRRNNDVDIVYPVHLNPNVKGPVNKILSGIERVHLLEPLEYDRLASLLKRAYLVLTDSGGIQEEAPTFGKPVLVLRHETERPEGIKAHVAKLVGTNTGDIVRNVELLLNDKKRYDRMSKTVSPYGDGKASRRIVAYLIKWLERGTR
jgi:UDP-N-acetylglucosamine 2-epimerase (non-hydrolysing)